MFVGSDRRAYPRTEANLVVSYRAKGIGSDYDISQSKNLSQGGMLLTTNRQFSPGDMLTMTLRLPYMPDAIEVVGTVVISKEVVPDLIYDTHIRFASLDQRAHRQLSDFVYRPEERPRSYR